MADQQMQTATAQLTTGKPPKAPDALQQGSAQQRPPVNDAAQNMADQLSGAAQQRPPVNNTTQNMADQLSGAAQQRPPVNADQLSGAAQQRPPVNAGQLSGAAQQRPPINNTAQGMADQLNGAAQSRGAQMASLGGFTPTSGINTTTSTSGTSSTPSTAAVMSASNTPPSSSSSSTGKPTGVSTPNSYDNAQGYPTSVPPTSGSTPQQSASTGTPYRPQSGSNGGGKIDTVAYFDSFTPPKPSGDDNTGDNNYVPGGDTGSGGGGSSTPSTSTTTTSSGDLNAEHNAAGQAAVQSLVSGVDTSQQIQAANDAWTQATQNYINQANQILGDLGANTTTNINNYQQGAQDIINNLSHLTGQQLAEYAAQSGQTIQQVTDQINGILAGLQGSLQPADVGSVDHVDINQQMQWLQQMHDQQQQQAQNQIDYAVNQGVTDLQRAEEDAQAGFQTERNQIAAAERQAMDNQALASEMRGDRGGIGQSQYNSIQNTAARNQLTVNSAQTKLSTDTARQIADLRAQGEFDKADKLLEISQSYLAKLMELKQWADNANISIDEFNIGVQQWEQEYNAQIQQFLGNLGIEAAQYAAGLGLQNQQYLTEQGINAANQTAQQNLNLASDVNQQTQNLINALAQYGLSTNQALTDAQINQIASILSAYQGNAQNMTNAEISGANLYGVGSGGAQTQDAFHQQQSQLAQAAQALISAGIKPDDAQLAALGWTPAQYDAYHAAQQAAAQAASYHGGGGSSNPTLMQIAQNWASSGVNLGDMNQQMTNLIAGGNYSQADQNAVWNYIGGLKPGVNYYETQTYADWMNK